jgi:phenylalanine-4-hydroxylase
MAPSSTSAAPSVDPGVRDYAARRAQIADLLTSGVETPHIDYQGYEDEVWQIVSAALAPAHEKTGCSEYLEGVLALDLGALRVPQLAEVSDKLETRAGFRLRATAGIASPSAFYGVLAHHRFLAAQFVRDADQPLFTPDPDVLHELIGHANALANPRIARIYKAAGDAFIRLTSKQTIDAFSKMFWYIFETGTVYENGQLKAFGAALLSSPGELAQLDNAAVQPVTTLTDMVTEPYDIGAYQTTLFAFESFDHLEDTLTEFFTTCNETTLTHQLNQAK